MVRALSTLALSFLLLTGAHAQSVPTAASKKAAVQASRATKKADRATKKAQRVAAQKQAAAAKAAKTAAATNGGWPPFEENAPVVASAATDDTYGDVRSESPYGRDNAYAAPGMSVNVRTTNKRVPYSVRQPRKPAQSETTLTNGQ